MKNELYLFTSEYPYGKKAETFLENEIPILAGNFDHIYLFPRATNSQEKRSVPSNVTIKDAPNDRINIRSGSIFFCNLFLIVKILLNELLHCSNKLFFIKRIRHFNSLIIRAIYDSKLILNSLTSTRPNVIFYSYWMNDWALALAILKEKKKIDCFIFRCGGFDIYDERHEGNYLPFRYFIYKNTKAILPNSIIGKKYLQGKKMFPEKIMVKYLGTSDHGMNPFDSANTFTLLSCSNPIPLKRVYLIIEILKHIDFDIKWIHFGDGVCLEELKKQAKSLPSNVIVDFKGSVLNQEIIKFYKSVPVNLFIATSETEGLPVSIQEAISFGVPIIATNVGGIPEVVNEQTGFLIEKNFQVKEVAELIRTFKTSSKNSIAFRIQVRDFWKERFDAAQVYQSFAQYLKEM